MFGNKPNLPLANAERISNALAAFHQAKKDLESVQVDIEDQIATKQLELGILSKEKTQVDDAISRISEITG